MQHAFLFIIMCTQSAIGLRLLLPYRFIPTPKATTLKDISADELKCPHCMERKIKDWNISITTYNESDVISRILEQDGTWETNATHRACDEYRIHGARGNMLDIGGNIGAFALPLAKCLLTYSKDNGRVIAVEAIKNNSQKFRASIKRNSFDNIHLYEYAVSSPDAGDTVTMSEHQGNHGHTVVINGSSDGSPETFESKTPVTTIDSIANVEGETMKRIFFLKLDIDGHEPKMLQGAENFMKNNGPCIIFAEFYNPDTKKYLETGEKPKADTTTRRPPTPPPWFQPQYTFDHSLSDIKKNTKTILEKWGYTEYIEENGTGGPEGWFKHKNWKECILRMQ